ncbi:transposable element Tcb2 transposase [Trichonephila clavipes]|nr:transposable element Tcb2 transposase [Trichonephila clavipes]
MLNGRTELHIFDRGSVIGDLYCEEVLLPHVRLFRGAIGPDFIFMDDNARPHRTLAVEELLESEDITRMDWPAYSLDLNHIEHVWDALGRRIAARLHHLENTQQLKQMLIEEWALLPQEMLHQLVLKPTQPGPNSSGSSGGGGSSTSRTLSGIGNAISSALPVGKTGLFVNGATLATGAGSAIDYYSDDVDQKVFNSEFI